MQKEGISKEDFEIAQRSSYGRYVRMFNNIESVASMLVVSHFGLVTPYDLLDKVASVTLEEVQQTLQQEMNGEYAALSIIEPSETH